MSDRPKHPHPGPMDPVLCSKCGVPKMRSAGGVIRGCECPPANHKLRARPLTRDQANALLKSWHRHRPSPVPGYRFAIAAHLGDRCVGCAVVGRPKARMSEQYRLVEVNRLVTDGTKNACSFLYARSARAAEAMGFDEIQTFILPEEDGASLRAAGWEEVGETRGDVERWHTRRKRSSVPEGKKRRWRKILNQ